jgi:hypothetical protein
MTDGGELWMRINASLAVPSFVPLTGVDSLPRLGPYGALSEMLVLFTYIVLIIKRANRVECQRQP